MPVETLESPAAAPANTQANTPDTSAQDSPAAQHDTPATEPAPKSPDTPKPSPKNTARDAHKALIEEARKKATERFAAKGEPGKAQATATPTPATAALAGAAALNPDDKAKPADTTAAPRKESITVKGRGEGGKDIELSLDQCRQALLRDGSTVGILAKLSKAEVLQYGSHKFLDQQVRDSFGNQANEWRRAAESGKAKPAQTPATPQAEAKAPEAPPAPAAQSAQTAPAAPPPTEYVSDADLKPFADVAGDDVAANLKPVLSQFASRIVEQASAQLSARDETYRQQLQQQQQATENLSRMYLNFRLTSEFDKRLEEFPQLKDEAIRKDLSNGYIPAIAKAMQDADPTVNVWDQLPQIVEQACSAKLGNQLRETAVRQALTRQERRANGQVDSAASSPRTPAAALSHKDIGVMTQQMLAEGKTPDEVRGWISSVQAGRR